MKKLSYYFAIVFLLGLVACQTKSDKLQVKQIDSLMILLDSANNKMAGVNFDSIDH